MWYANLATVVLLALAVVGCTAEQLETPSRQVAASGVDSALQTLDSPESQAMIDSVVRSPAIQDTAEQIGRGIVRGAVETGGEWDALRTSDAGRRLTHLTVAVVVVIALGALTLIVGVWSIAWSVRHAGHNEKGPVA
jgi:hypothetical protein